MLYITIGGHLGADPERKVTNGGRVVYSLRVAVRTRKNREDRTVWFSVSAWGEDFKRVVDHLHKGSALIVVGELEEPEMYTTKNGVTQVRLSIRAARIDFPSFGKPNRDRREGALPGEGPDQQGNGQEQKFTNQRSIGSSPFEDVPF